MCIFCLIACDSKPRYTNNPILVKEQDEPYRITYINPPKHFSVDIVNETTWESYVNVASSKHCRNWGNIHIGDRHMIRTKYYKQKNDSGEFVYYKQLDNINHILCKA